MVDRASLRIAGGIAVVIIVLLAGMFVLARMQMPREVAATVSGDSDIETSTADEELADGESAEEATDDDAAESESTADEAEPETEETAEEPSEETNSADAGADSADDVTDDVTEDVTADEGDVADETSDDSQAVASVDLSHGELTSAFAAGGCTSCHVIPDIAGAIGQLGPDLSTIGSVAATRVEGQSAEDYLRESLHDPGAFVVEACPTGPCTAGIMQAANLNALTDDEVEGMIQYMLALTDDADNAVAAGVETEAADSTDEEATEDSATEEPATEEATTEEVAEDTTEDSTAEEPVDVDAVAAIVTKGTCGACHVIPGIDGAGGMVGPDLSNIGTAAETRIDGYSAEEYLLESILDPNAFIAPECPAGDCLPGLMLPNLADLLTTEEIDTLVSYLVTLDGE